MELKPIKLSKKPGYPTIRAYVENPALLSENIPLKWIKNRYVAASLAAFILCTTPKETYNLKAKPSILFDKSIKNKNPEGVKKEKKDSVKIAPIFAHGEGNGASGCMVITPPVFISESEALQIIMKAFEEEDIKLDTANLSTNVFQVFPIDNYFRQNFKDTTKLKANIKINAYSPKLNFEIYYVSLTDTKEFKKHKLDGLCEFCYKTKTVAKIIQQELENQNKTNAVVFYDPVQEYGYINGKEVEKDEALNQSKKLLLAQVEDFIKWIKKEGILNK